ncbi:hypothetical protein B0H17DRAFT_1146126 [Mycena rosella]|uniref:Secreted protein n=1 Tax=Mycena rosella TaxID=1033263 RepID=A0AAD7G129_MYCRO|nr:hypothetical protein B0H17DRAFT_1146126 [Mycena rosella]
MRRSADFGLFSLLSLGSLTAAVNSKGKCAHRTRHCPELIQLRRPQATILNGIVSSLLTADAVGTALLPAFPSGASAPGGGSQIPTPTLGEMAHLRLPDPAGRSVHGPGLTWAPLGILAGGNPASFGRLATHIRFIQWTVH